MSVYCNERRDIAWRNACRMPSHGQDWEWAVAHNYVQFLFSFSYFLFVLIDTIRESNIRRQATRQPHTVSSATASRASSFHYGSIQMDFGNYFLILPGVSISFAFIIAIYTICESDCWFLHWFFFIVIQRNMQMNIRSVQCTDIFITIYLEFQMRSYLIEIAI